MTNLNDQQQPITKKQLLELLENFPDDSKIELYDLRDFSHPIVRFNQNDHYNLETSDPPLLTFELYSENE